VFGLRKEKNRKRGQNTYNIQKYHFRVSYGQKRRKKIERGVKIHIITKNTILECLMIRKEEEKIEKRVSKYHFRLSYDQKRRKK
jgi:hypothetical protein